MSGAERARRRLGLFGGSFDPVHAGHLHVARAAARAFRLERILFVPAARPPHKPGRVLADGRHRLAMLQLALGEEPGFQVDALELERPGPSFTIDTVRALAAREEGPDAAWHLILGADNLPGLPEWREVTELLRRVQPIVVYRSGEPREVPPAVREALGPEAAAKLERGLLRLPPVEVSATELRAQLAAGRDPGAALPPGVYAYVRAHGLYGGREREG